MSEHSVADAMTHLSTLIDRALKGEEVVITRHGRPVVALTPLSAGKPRMTTAESIAWLRANRVKGLLPQDEDAGSLVSRMRDEDQRS